MTGSRFMDSCLHENDGSARQLTPENELSQPINISAKQAISSNLLLIDLDNAPLCGIDELIGPSINLENYSQADVINLLNDIDASLCSLRFCWVA